MRKFFILFVIFAYALILNAQKSIDVPVRTTKEITSQDKNISVVSGIVDGDVYYKDSLIIRSGAPVEINLECSKARALGAAGSVTISLVRTFDIKNRPVRLYKNFTVTGEDRELLAIGLGFGLGLFTVVGYFAFLIKGTEAVVNAGTIIYGVAYLE